MDRFTHLIAALVLLLFATGSWAQQTQDERVAEFEQRLEETRARLDLTELQTEQVTSILRGGFLAQREVMEKHGFDVDSGERPELSRREMRALRKDMNEVQEETLNEMEKVLTTSQFDEYKKLQDERRAARREMLKQMREQQSDSG